MEKNMYRVPRSCNISIDWIRSNEKIMEKKKRIFSNMDITLIVPTHKMYNEVKIVYFSKKKFIKYQMELTSIHFFF